MLIQKLQDLRNRTVESFCGAMEFRAITQLTYDLATEGATAPGAAGGAIIGYEQFAKHLGVKNLNIEVEDFPKKIEEAKNSYLLFLAHQQQVALFEHILFDVLRDIIVDQPLRLPSDKKIDYQTIILASDKEEIVFQLVERELNELKYKSVSEWFVYIKKLVNSCNFSEIDIKNIAELKATRDIIVHNGGIVNDIYLKKSGELARHAAGEKVSVSSEYVLHCWVTLSRVLLELIDKLINSFKPKNNT